MATEKDDTPQWAHMGTLTNEEKKRRNGQTYRVRQKAKNDGEKKIPWGLNLWPDEIAGMPSEITRSALFGLPRRGRRKFRENEVIESGPDLTLRYFGTELDHHDLSLWLVLLMASQGQRDDYKIRTRMSHLLKTLGRLDCGSNRKWLGSAIERLAQGSFHLECSRNIGSGKKELNVMFHFLSGAAFDKNTGEIVIKLGEGKKILFGYTSLLDFEEHITLPSQMCMAIHRYAVGQPRRKRHGIPIDRLKGILGYAGEMRNFKPALREGLQELEKRGLLSDVKIGTDNIVRWVLNPLQLNQS